MYGSIAFEKKIHLEISNSIRFQEMYKSQWKSQWKVPVKVTGKVPGWRIHSYIHGYTEYIRVYTSIYFVEAVYVRIYLSIYTYILVDTLTPFLPACAYQEYQDFRNSDQQQGRFHLYSAFSCTCRLPTDIWDPAEATLLASGVWQRAGLGRCRVSCARRPQFQCPLRVWDSLSFTDCHDESSTNDVAKSGDVP